MKQTLYLLRHAKAEPWYPGVNDFDRALNDRGREQMSNLCRWLATRLKAPSAALCSPSVRTRETIGPLFAIWPELRLSTEYVSKIYEASTGTLLHLAETAFEHSETVLMVGHNPGFESLAHTLVNPAEQSGLNRMSTGTMAAIEFEGGYSNSCGQGRLLHWLRGKDL